MARDVAKVVVGTVIGWALIMATIDIQAMYAVRRIAQRR